MKFRDMNSVCSIKGREPIACTDEQIYALMGAAKEYEETVSSYSNMRLVLLLGFYLGLRRNEICAAKWNWFDWKHNNVYVRQEGMFKTKNRKNRTIPFFDVVKRSLDRLREHRQNAQESIPSIASDYLIAPNVIWRTGARWRLDFSQAFDSVCQNAGVPIWPHCMRHTFCTRALQIATVDQVAKWLGHSTSDLIDRYGHYIQPDNRVLSAWVDR